MLSARQLLLMRLARNRAIDIAIAPLGTVVLLPDPDLRRRVFRCVSHVEAHVCRSYAMQQKHPYSISSLARRRSDSGIVKLRALAVVRLMMRSNLVGCSTGMSPGLAPRRILST